MKCFLDTNTLIHYKLFTEIDWTNVLDFSEVELIICPMVLTELDQKKMHHSDLDIRNRCRQIVGKLRECANNELRLKNSQLTFISREPRVNWIDLGLDPSINDDRIIASIIECGDTQNSILITSDFGLELKAKSHGILTKSMSDNLRAELKNSNEKEFLKLKEKIAILENAKPKLQLKFTQAANLLRQEYQILMPKDKFNSDVAIAKLQAYLDKKVNRVVSSKFIPSSIGQMTNPLIYDYFLSENDIFRYKEENKKYLERMKIYFDDYWDYKNLLARIFKIQLSLVNDGGVPADDIDISLHLPDGFEVFEKAGLPVKPKSPTIPAEPLTLSQKLKNNFALSMRPNYIPSGYLTGFNNGKSKDDCSPKIKKSHSYDVSYKITRLKHKTSFELDPLYIFFEDNNLIKSFSFTYQILDSKNPEYQRGTLNVVLEKKN